MQRFTALSPNVRQRSDTMVSPLHRHTLTAGVVLSLMLPAMGRSVSGQESAYPMDRNATGDPVQQGVIRPLSMAERGLFRGYYAVLQAPGPRSVSHSNLLLQIRRNPPVAFVNGFWATPIDLGAVLQIPAIRDALDEALVADALGEAASELLADPTRLKQQTAIAFTANTLRTQMGLPFVGDFERIRASDPETSTVFVVPVKDLEWVVVEHMPPTVAPPDTEPECYFFCGEPETWDFDGDGMPNSRDDDNDNDGALDTGDDYPYWPGGNTCGCEPDPFLLFATKFTSGLTKAVLAAHSLVEHIGPVSRAVALGPVPGSEAEVQFLFPTSALPLEEIRRNCPDPDDPSIRYVDIDPENCAAVRFRCRKGEEGFSNRCGCGCRQP